MGHLSVSVCLSVLLSVCLSVCLFSKRTSEIKFRSFLQAACPSTNSVRALKETQSTEPTAERLREVVARFVLTDSSMLFRPVHLFDAHCGSEKKLHYKTGLETWLFE